MSLPGKSRNSAACTGREGRAATGLLLGLAALVAVLAFLWIATDERRPGRARTEPPPPPSPVTPPAAGLLESASAPEARAGPGQARADQQRAAEPRLARLEVVALAPEGSVLANARLEILDEAGSVASATLEARAPRASFELAPGTYTLALTQPGPPLLACLPVELELGAGEAHSAELRLLPCWSCSGFVTEEGARGLEGLRVTLERPGAEALATHTDGLGHFAFPPQPEGEIALAVGDPLGPLVPRLPVRLEAALGALEIRVPRLLELTLRVVDTNGFPVASAEVDGNGESGGRFAGVTDADGELRARHLPAGNYRAFARRADVGRGTRSFVLAPDTTAIEISLLAKPER